MFNWERSISSGAKQTSNIMWETNNTVFIDFASYSRYRLHTSLSCDAIYSFSVQTDDHSNSVIPTSSAPFILLWGGFKKIPLEPKWKKNPLNFRIATSVIITPSTAIVSRIQSPLILSITISICAFDCNKESSYNDAIGVEQNRQDGEWI